MTDEVARKAGRPKGSRNKASRRQIEEIRRTGQTPLEYLVSIYQDESEEKNIRIDAAKAAAPYCHAKLASIDLKAGIVEISHEEWLETLL